MTIRGLAAGFRRAPGTGSTTSKLRGTLARNTLWMLAGQFARALVQAAYFVCLARALGVSGYGAFLGVTALVAILGPYVGLGAGVLLIQETVRDRSSFRGWWGYAISATAVSGAALVLVAAAVSRVVLPGSIGVGLVCAIGVADLVFNRLVEVSGQAALAFERLRRTAQLAVLPTFLRFLAAGLMLWKPALASPAVWGLLYLAATALAAVAAVCVVSRDHGLPLLRGSLRVRHAQTGFYFSVAMSAQSVYNDIDKTLMARLGTLSAAGIYGAAYRVVDVSFTPVRSLLAAAYARFFEHGASGIGAALGFARKLVPMAAAYAAAAALALYFGAPVLPLVLGDDFTGAVQAVRWLAVIPFLRALHCFAADALTGSNLQGVRSAIQAAVALLCVGLNLWLIPLYSWRGAAGASIACDALLVAGMWGAVWMAWRRARAPRAAVRAEAAPAVPVAAALRMERRAEPAAAGSAHGGTP